MDSKTKHGRHAASDARHRPRCATDDEHVMTERRGEPGQRTKEENNMTNSKSKTQKRKREREKDRRTDRETERVKEKERKTE